MMMIKMIDRQMYYYEKQGYKICSEILFAY